MLTVKATSYGDPSGDSVINFAILQADHVEEILHPKTGNRSLRLMRYMTSSGVVTNNETVLPLDADRVYGPAIVFVENSEGRTLQKFTADRAIKRPVNT